MSPTWKAITAGTVGSLSITYFDPQCKLEWIRKYVDQVRNSAKRKLAYLGIIPHHLVTRLFQGHRSLQTFYFILIRKMTVPKALVLITGANQGIGFATARRLASSNKFHVLVGARTASKDEAAVQQLQSNAVDKSALTSLTIDVIDDASITAAAGIVSE